MRSRPKSCPPGCAPPRYTAALDYRIFGLINPEFTRRETDDFVVDEGEPEPLLAVWLGHGTSDLAAGVRVGTIDRRRMEMRPHNQLIPGDPVLSVASYGVESVTWLTLPDPVDLAPGEPSAEYMHLIVAHAREQVLRYATWPDRRVRIDGEWFPVKCWEYAGAWAALIDSLPDVYVLVSGYGIEVDDLDLQEVTEGSPYGIDVAGPLDRHRPERRNREIPVTMLPRLVRRTLHPDQRNLPRR
jgi:hypothetical protein